MVAMPPGDLRGASALNQRHLLNDHEVANFLRVSTATVRRWRLLGQGPRFRKLGSSVRYALEDVEKWLEDQPTGGSEGLEAGK
jgi:predicted DNA-binding transcriptional regulator AlpA